MTPTAEGPAESPVGGRRDKSDPTDRLLDRLDRVTRRGSGWAAACPAHDDRSAALTVHRGPGGTPRVRCGLGCAEDVVWAAAGLPAPAGPRGVWRGSGEAVDPAPAPAPTVAEPEQPERDPGAPEPPELNAPPWQIEPVTDPHHGLLLPTIHALVEPYVERARQHGRIPPLRSDAWLDAHPDQQLASVLIAGIDRILFDPRALFAGLIRDAGKDIAGSAGAALAEQSTRSRDAARAPMRGATGRCWQCGCIEHHDRPGTGGCRTCGCPRQHDRQEGSA